MSAAETDLTLLRPELRLASISDREIVLPFEEAMGALYYFRTKEIGVLGWEDWLLLRDGKKTHSTIQGTVSVEPESNENWSDYVNRSLNFALETIEKDHQAFLKSSESSRGKLHFCITPLTQREWVLRSNTAQKGRDLGAV